MHAANFPSLQVIMRFRRTIDLANHDVRLLIFVSYTNMVFPKMPTLRSSPNEVAGNVSSQILDNG